MISILMLARVEHDVIRSMTRKAIQSVYTNTHGDTPQIVLVRNGALDLGIREDEFPGRKLTIINSPEHMSLSVAYNAAYRVSYGDPICVMHNDVEVPPGWNEPLEKVAGMGHIAFPMVNERDSMCDKRGILPTQPWQTTGACFMMSKASWEKLGGYDEGFVGYHWEDTELFYRAIHKGMRLIRVKTEIVHHRGATRSFTRNEEDPCYSMNEKYFIKKHGGKYIPSISDTPQEV
jgi:glycosyltransferase involved in cell wall biosynthesis